MAVLRMRSWQSVHGELFDSKGVVHVPLRCLQEDGHSMGRPGAPMLQEDRDEMLALPQPKARTPRSCSYATAFRTGIFWLVISVTIGISTFGGWKFLAAVCHQTPDIIVFSNICPTADASLISGSWKLLAAVCRHTPVGEWRRLGDLCPVADASVTHSFEEYIKDVVDQRVERRLQQYRTSQAVPGNILDQDLSQVVLGARIVIQLTSPTVPVNPSPSSVHLPVVVLESGMILGDCWMSVGKRGHIAIQLPRPANLTAISVHHFPMQHLPPAHRLQAPKTIVLWGLVRVTRHASLTRPVRSRNPLEFARQAKLPPGIAFDDLFVPLANMTYDIGGPSKQVAYIRHEDDVRSLLYDVVLVEVVENWGGDNICLYHVGIHGQIRDTDGYV
ncbi:hypothetical protein NMY22_g10145 [Coprinellus aureogranulatus]|nr:hypothetical protein NMY22_g10145 [Coprinellus aureogranulatus]